MCDKATTIPPLNQTDVEGVRLLLTSVLSIIFYARRAFPADCFQLITGSEMLDPKITHATMIDSGVPITPAEDNLDAILAERGPAVYLRRSDNPRVTRFFDTLDQIFDHLRERRLGKIQFCLTKSKIWDRNSLIEFYSVKFSYTKLGSVHMYLDWGGDSGLFASVGDKQSLRAFLRTRPTLGQSFYVHPFLYSIDGTSLGAQKGSGFGRDIKNAVAVLRNRKGTELGRVEKFIYYSPADTAVEKAEQEAENRRREDQRKMRAGVLAIVKNLQNESFGKHFKHSAPANPSSSILGEQKDEDEPMPPTQTTFMGSTPPQYEAPLWMTGEENFNASAAPDPNLHSRHNPILGTQKSDRQCHSWLIGNEEDDADMPPTQPPGDPTGLSESQLGGRRHEMASSIRPPSSYQSRNTSFQAQI